MSEEELQLLITLDDPLDPPEEDIFSHLQAKNNFEYWLGQQLPACYRPAKPVSDNDAHMVTFAQGDWTCTLSRLNGTTNEVEVCTVTHSRDGEIVEQKVFYDFRGLQQ